MEKRPLSDFNNYKVPPDLCPVLEIPGEYSVLFPGTLCSCYGRCVFIRTGHAVELHWQGAEGDKAGVVSAAGGSCWLRRLLFLKSFSPPIPGH